MAKKIKRTRPTSLTLRLALGKLLGFLLGGLVFVSLGQLGGVALSLKLGMWGWYILFGAVIALAGLYVRCPLTGWPLPALLRGALLGAVLNLVLALLIQQDVTLAFSAYEDFRWANTKPLLDLMFEGLIWGALFDVALTFYAGQGKDLVKKL